MPQRITGNYASHTKDELLAEIAERAIPNINGDMLKAEIVEALEMNDMEREEAEKETPAAPEAPTPPPAPDKPLTAAEIAAPKKRGPVPSNIPTIAMPETTEVRYIGQPPPNSEYSGLYRQLSTGHMFALAVLKAEDVENNKTHYLKNSEYMWNGTAAEFRDQFEKQ